MVNSDKTIVVLGCYRGGTSMVAGALRCLGIFMGDDLGEEAGGSNYEDLEFQKKDSKTIIKLIEKRNKDYSVWGWKDPATVVRINEFHGELRNPHFVSIYRDPYAIALSELKHNDRPVNIGLKTAMGHLMYMCKFAEDYSQYPNMKISYEKTLGDPKHFVDKLILFMGISFTSEQRQNAIDFISPGGYK